MSRIVVLLWRQVLLTMRKVGLSLKWVRKSALGTAFDLSPLPRIFLFDGLDSDSLRR